MEFKINIVSDDENFAVQQSQNLKTWIESDEELGPVKVKQERKELQKDDAGGGLLSVIQVAIGAAIEPFARTMQVWMEEKTKRSTAEFSIELEDPAGKKFRINSKNIGDSDKAFVAEIVKRFEGNKDYDYKITQE
ncbi:MAG: hypothetical protein MUC31_01275 [Bacteroidales bacterium]|jgi:hypothetical protein|nr:hypothetical protein [Bacteroidales bacterium]